METLIHPKAEVATSLIGHNTTIWQFAIVLEGAKIGKECNINCHTFIEGGVEIGDRVTVKSGVYLWDGVKIEDDVFIGPNVTFINDLRPRSKQRPAKFLQTMVRKSATIGANATIMGGLIIGEFAMIGAGSVVTKDVPGHALVYGNPARIMGWVDTEGNKLLFKNGKWLDKQNQKYRVVENRLIKEQ